MIVTGQASVGTAVTFVTPVPPGQCSVILGNSGGTAVYVGSTFGTGVVTTTNGFVIPAGLFMPALNCPPGSPGGTLKAVVAGGTGVLNWMIADSRGFPLPTPGTP